MYDSPKAAHFAAYDHSGRKLHYADRRGIDARWLAAKYAREAGVTNMLARPTVAMLAALMDACSRASAAIGQGLRVRMDADEIRFLRERAEWMQPATRDGEGAQCAGR